MSKENVENGGRVRDFVDPDTVENFAMSVRGGIGEQVDKKEEKEREKKQNTEQSPAGKEENTASEVDKIPESPAQLTASQSGQPELKHIPEEAPPAIEGVNDPKNESDQIALENIFNRQRIELLSYLDRTIGIARMAQSSKPEFVGRLDEMKRLIFRSGLPVEKDPTSATSEKTKTSGNTERIRSISRLLINDYYYKLRDIFSSVVSVLDCFELPILQDKMIDKIQKQFLDQTNDFLTKIGQKRDKLKTKSEISTFLESRENKQNLDFVIEKLNTLLDLAEQLVKQGLKINAAEDSETPASQNPELPVQPAGQSEPEKPAEPPPIPRDTLEVNLGKTPDELAQPAEEVLAPKNKGEGGRSVQQVIGGPMPDDITLADMSAAGVESSDGDEELPPEREVGDRDVPGFGGNSWTMAFLRWIGAGRFAHNLDAVKFRNMIKNMSAFSTIKKAEGDYLDIVKRIETFRRALINIKNLALESSNKNNRKISVRRAISKILSSTEGEVNGNALIQDVVPTEEADLDSSLINAYEGQYEEIRKKMNSAIAEREEMAERINRMKRNVIDVVDGYCTSVIEYENLDGIKQKFDVLSEERLEQEKESKKYQDAIKKLSSIINSMRQEGNNSASYQRCVERLQNLQKKLFVIDSELFDINRVIGKVERKMDQINDRVNALKSIRYDLGLDFEKKPTVYENDNFPAFKEIMREIGGKDESELESDNVAVVRNQETEEGGVNVDKAKSPGSTRVTGSSGSNTPRVASQPSFAGGYEGRNSRTPKYRKKSLFTRFLGLFFKKR